MIDAAKVVFLKVNLPFYKTYPKLPKSRHIWTAITLVFTSCFITAISVELTVSDRSS